MNQSCKKELAATAMHRLESVPTAGCCLHPRLQPRHRLPVRPDGGWHLEPLTCPAAAGPAKRHSATALPRPEGTVCSEMGRQKPWAVSRTAGSGPGDLKAALHLRGGLQVSSGLCLRHSSRVFPGAQYRCSLVLRSRHPCPRLFFTICSSLLLQTECFFTSGASRLSQFWLLLLPRS